jgi:POT family proton-dependent oligopeptide transporter
MAQQRYPRSIPFIVATEAGERFSYYGMRSILTVYLVSQFFNPTANPALQAAAEAAANEKTHLFVALAYFMPVLGALLADVFWGRYRVVLGVSLLYCVGHLLLAIFDQRLDGFSLGLLLLAIGAGGIKSNVTAFVGDQFDESNRALLEKSYGWFYFSINAGAVVSMALIPWLLEHAGARVAFGVPGIFMLAATALFFSGRRHYRHEPPRALRVDAAQWRERLRVVLRLLVIFAFVPAFWALWDQSQSEWVLQAEKLDLTLWPGLVLLPAQVQLANPVFILSLIPVFTYGVYPALKAIGLDFTPLRRIGAGLFLTALSFVVIAGVQQRIEAGVLPSVWWQILAYLLLTVAEILVNITGLEYAYRQAPEGMKSFIAALWLLTVAVGNILVSRVNASILAGGFFAQYTGAAYFWFFVKFMLVMASAFVAVAALTRNAEPASP